MCLLQTTEGVETVLAAGTIIPFRAHHTFTLAPDQTSFKMIICEIGQGEGSSDVKRVAKVHRPLEGGGGHLFCLLHNSKLKMMARVIGLVSY